MARERTAYLEKNRAWSRENLAAFAGEQKALDTAIARVKERGGRVYALIGGGPKDLNKRFDLDYTWNGDCIDFTRPGLTGQLHILKDEVRLDCKLGFLLGTNKSAFQP